MEILIPKPLEETDPELAEVLIAWSQNHPGKKVLRKPATVDQLIGAIGTQIDFAKSKNLKYVPRFWERVRNLLNNGTVPESLAPALGRNERCWCGSGKKFKKCCINK